ncbi:MAG: restriction endonuclease subunit S [Candidatus Hodarchaeales archaeon]|jgi:type I restriction enzyme S subunit
MVMKNNNNLPQGWQSTQLINLGKFFSGVTYKKGDASKESKEGYLPVLRANNINNELNFDNLVYVPKEKIKDEQFIRKNDIVICMSSGSKHLVGKSAQASNDFDGGFGAFCGLFRCHLDVNGKYVGYFFQSPNYRMRVSEVSQGININNLRRANIESMGIPLAPLPEQERIVTKIEQLFIQLDAGVAKLQKGKAQLKRYRQAVLKAAVEGELTREWREARQDGLEPASELLERILIERKAKWEEEELTKMRAKGKEPKDDKWKNKYKEPAILDKSKLPELPQGWIWSTIGAITDTVGGVTKGRKFHGRKTISVPYLRVANVQQGYLDLGLIKEIDILADELEKYELKNNDLLLTEGGDWDKLGRSAIWHNQIKGCVHQNHIFRARPFLESISTTWLMYCTNSEYGRKYFAASSKQTTNLASINLTQLRAFPIPLPTRGEQNQVISIVERRLSIINEIEQQLDQGLIRAERLRQAILKQAFEGKMVSQDPNDEPAAVLLDRINKDSIREEINKDESKHHQLDLFD